jgi:hypothetical protein
MKKLSPKHCIYCNTILTSVHGHRRAAKYCNNQCQQDHQYKVYIEKWKNKELDGSKGLGVSAYVKRYLRQKYNNKCSKCGWSQPNPITGHAILEVDHINGDWKDNSEENLDLICCNCHTLTINYKALNIGKGRNGYLKSLKL